MNMMFKTLFFGSLVFLYVLQEAWAASHFCYETRNRQERARRTGSRSCGWWGRRCRYTYYVHVTQSYQQRICCRGYTGSSCNIPVCNPPCQNNAVCYDVNDCYCRSGTGGSSCSEPVYCSAAKDCYPGTCYGSNTCRCSSGFEGSTCNTIRDGGIYEYCSITLQGEGNREYITDCKTQNENKYTNITDLRDIKLEWKVSWQLPEDTPTAPNYVLETRPGITDSYSQLVLADENGIILHNNNQECTGHDMSASNPFFTVECRNVYHTLLPHDAQEDHKLRVKFFTRTGGYKRIQDLRTNSIVRKNYIGKTHESSEVEIILDTGKPRHCTTELRAAACTFEESPAIAIYPDNLQGEDFKPQVFGWEDSVSGIKQYKFKVYQLEYNPAIDKLVHGESPLREENWDPVDESPTFSVDIPGVYSIVAEVHDYAGNIALARTIFISETENHVEVQENSRLSVNPSHISNIDNTIWIKESGDFTVSWVNIFINRQHLNNHFMSAVQANVAYDVDDNLEEGNRTIAPVQNFNGITRFDLGWRKLPSSLVQWEEIDELIEEYDMQNIDRNDGDVVEFTTRGYDITNYFKSYTVNLYVDSTMPEFQRGSEVVFEPNIISERPDMHYTSRIQIQVFDEHSGIEGFEFTLHYVGVQTTIHTSSQLVSRLTAECASVSDDCYCIATGSCFTYDQYIWIDNCVFIDHDTDSGITLEYSVINGAGIATSPRSAPIMGSLLMNLEGIDYYPTPTDIGVTRNRDDTLNVVWHLPPTCFPYETITLVYINTGVEHRQRLSNVTQTKTILHGLEPNTRFDLWFEVTHRDISTVTTSERATFNSGSVEEKETSGGLSAGGIAGIIIAIIIFGLLTAALIVVLIRLRKHQHPVPLVLREAPSNMRDGISRRLSRHHVVQRHGEDPYDNNMMTYDNNTNMAMNVAYSQEAEEDMYIYGNMETDPEAQWKFSKDKLTITGTLHGAKGRFADLKMGNLSLENGTKQVVVKMNKVGASSDDKLLMTAKMNFLATAVPQHDLLVNLVGAVPPPIGPMIILDYCDSGSLLHWASKITKFTEDIEEQMIMFSMQTAIALEFLHDKGILHRRLGARNVLLHTDPLTQQMVARLTGFGPLKCEQDNSGKSDDRVPIKWMAPEQLNKPKGEKRLYNKKTDVWSYGILLWELFSKGEKPYADLTIGEMKRKVADGHRMKKLNHCPNYMFQEIITPCWDGDADMRPEMTGLVAKLNKEYGPNRGDIYDYDVDYKRRSRFIAMQVD